MYTGHLALVGEIRNAYISQSGNPEGRDHFGDLHIDENIILKCILKK
jgi:hypothetical protein